MNQENKGNKENAADKESKENKDPKDHKTKKENKLLKIIRWFFEEEKNPEQSNVDEDAINLGPIQIILILAMTAIFSFWIFYEPIKGFFYKQFFESERYIKTHIEKNYFSPDHKLENNDFNQGLEHWVTSDGGKLFPNSKSIASIDSKEFHSAPSCLKIQCLVPASRYHYSKKTAKSLINNAYSYRQTECWLGVLPNADVKASLWYKGDIIKFTVNVLKPNGQWDNLASVSGSACSQWEYIELKGTVPNDGRAIMLEITLNQARGMPLPMVLVDDVNIQVANPEK
ncbi:MAG: hypothetical protein V1747_02070 [Candidatus Omnitrophota bacterium]